MATRQDFLRVAKNRIRTTPGSTLDPSLIDKPGSVLNILLNAGSAMAEECDARDAARAAALLSATARDADLDQVVQEQTFGLLARKAASAAVWNVTIQRPTAAAGGGVIPAGTVMVAGGQLYALDAPDLVFGASDLSQSATFTCQTTGSVGNQAPSAISGFQTPAALFDPTLSIVPTSTDPEVGSATGGDEPEVDADFRARRALFDSGLDRNIDLLAATALAVPGVRVAIGIEQLGTDGAPIGFGTVYVADVNGRANAALVQRVQNAFRRSRLFAQFVDVIGAAPSLESIVLHIGTLNGFDPAQVQSAVVAAVIGYVNGLLPGATMYVSGITAAILSVPGAVLESSYPTGVVSPATDIVASSSSTLFRTRSDLVTFG